MPADDADHLVASNRCPVSETADPRYDGVTGQYFAGDKPIRSSADSYDLDKARDLWDASERLAAR